MIRGTRHAGWALSFAMVLAVGAALPEAQAQIRLGESRVSFPGTMRLVLTVGKSELIDLPEPFTRVSVTNPAIADVFVTTPKQVLVNGKAAGVTNLLVFYLERTLHFDLVIQTDIVVLQERLRRFAPRDEIGIQAAGDSIILTGQVSSGELVGQAGQIAEIFAPKKVVNLLKVGETRPQQVLLQVQVAEVTRTALRQFGFSFISLGSSFQGGAWPGAPLIPAPGVRPFGTSDVLTDPFFAFSDFSTFFLATAARDFFTIVRVLEQKGLLRTLAKPNLVTVSGKEAKFLSGGEFPYPVPSSVSAGSQTISIEFKPFGVQLGFTPIVREDQTISMLISPEVSSLDFTQGLQLQGFSIPVIRSNRVGTSIELKDGESFAIAGLINTEVRQQIAKVPLLGDIPILGALFRSTQFLNNESELVFVVTVRLVKPSPPGGGPDPRQLMEMRKDESNIFGFTLIPGIPRVGDIERPIGESNLRVGEPGK